MIWFTWTQQWIELKWPHWAGTTRRTAVETLAAITPRMVKPKAPPPPADLVDWLRTDGYIPGSERYDSPPARTRAAARYFVRGIEVAKSRPILMWAASVS